MLVKSNYNLCVELGCVSIALQEQCPKQSTVSMTSSYFPYIGFDPMYEKLNMGNFDRLSSNAHQLRCERGETMVLCYQHDLQ